MKDEYTRWLELQIRDTKKDEKTFAKEHDYGLAQWQRCRWMNLSLALKKYKEMSKGLTLSHTK